MRLDEQPATRDALDRFLDHVRTHLADRVAEVRLFGSSVRDDWRPDSDVDLLVLVDDKSWALTTDIHAPCPDVLTDLGVDLSPRIVPLSTWRGLVAEGQRFASEVEAEGVPLWTRG